jgi:hypothetical protein
MWLCSRIVSSCARPSSFQLLDGDPQTRADALIAAVTAMGINPIVKSKDLSSGNDKLNLGLVAQIFNAKPNLEPATAEEVKELGDDFAKLEVRGALFFSIMYFYKNLSNVISFLRWTTKTWATPAKHALSVCG